MATTYEEYLRAHLSALERFGDKLTGVDERIDFLAPRILELGDKLQNISKRMDALIDAMKDMGITVTTRVEQIPFVYTISAGQVVTLQEVSPFSGYVTSVMIHWPDGCNGKVDVAVLAGTTQIVPKEGFLSLNDTTQNYNFGKSITVERNDSISVILRNRGSMNHTITVMITVEG
jgi:hypothetical protein